MYSDDANIQTNSQRKTQVTSGILAGKSANFRGNRKRPQIIENTHTHNNTHNNDTTTRKTAPGNSTYADITRHGKKVCIVGASIIQRINMREFNKHLYDKHAVKVSYPGATASRATYYMKKPLEEENPDIVIINIGTNNLTKNRDQSEEETANQILHMVEECRNLGVNEIFVSGLTVRKGYFKKVKIINNILVQNAKKFNFTFIDNSDIQGHHLHHDGLHLEYDGTCILANNFIDHLNDLYSFNMY